MRDMKAWAAHLICGLLIAAAAVPAAAPQAAAAPVEIQVTGATGSMVNNLDGIGVVLTDLTTGQTFSAETDRQGRARFGDVPPGNYQVRVSGRALQYYDYRKFDKPRASAVAYPFSDLAAGAGSDESEMIASDREGAIVSLTQGGFLSDADDSTDLINRRLRMHRIALERLKALDLDTLTTDKWMRYHQGIIDDCENSLEAVRVARRSADPVLGTWDMQPITIKNPALCGNVTYNAYVIVEQKVSETHYIGFSPFNWDLSKADPECTFKFHPVGTARVDLYRQGDAITIKYTYDGPNTYADDRLTLQGNVMSGRDASGAAIVFTRR